MQPIAICFHDPEGIRTYPETSIIPLMPGVCSVTYEPCHVTALLPNGQEVKFDPSIHGHLLPYVPRDPWRTNEPGCPYLTTISSMQWVPYNLEELRERWAASVQKETTVSRFRGTPGVREDFLLTYDTSVGPFSSEYGDRWCHKFYDKKDRFIWWTDKLLNIIPTEQRYIRATVSKHERYEGIEVTTLTRCSPLKGEAKLTITPEGAKDD